MGADGGAASNSRRPGSERHALMKDGEVSSPNVCKLSIDQYSDVRPIDCLKLKELRRQLGSCLLQHFPSCRPPQPPRLEVLPATRLVERKLGVEIMRTSTPCIRQGRRLGYL